MLNSYQQNAAYKKTQIETATPEALILMLYDGALKFMAQAEAAFEENDIEMINNRLQRTQAIFTELMISLDKSKGDIPANLERLYVFFLNKLSEANVKKDPEPLLEIKPLVVSLRDTWAEAMQKVQTGQSQQQHPRLNLAV